MKLCYFHNWLTRWPAIVLAVTLPLNAAAQINHEIEIDHLQSLSKEGRWLEAIDETTDILQRMRDNPKTELDPAFYLQCSIFLAQTAVDAGDSKIFQSALTDLGDRIKDRAFASAARQVGPAANFVIQDLRVRDLINENQLDKALKAIVYRPKMKADQTSEVPKDLIFTDLAPLCFATTIYLEKGDESRAKVYLSRLRELVATFPEAEPETQATVASLNGRLAQLQGRFDEAQKQFHEARGYIQTAFNGNHPKEISLLIAEAELALTIAELAHKANNLQKAAILLRTAETSLNSAKALAEPALSAESSIRNDLSRVVGAMKTASESWGSTLVPLERAEAAARETLRLLHAFGVRQPDLKPTEARQGSTD